MTFVLPEPVRKALAHLGILDDELLAVVNEAASRDPSLKESGEAVVAFIRDKVAPHLGLEAASAIGRSVLAQILGKKPGFDPDHAMDA